MSFHRGFGNVVSERVVAQINGRPIVETEGYGNAILAEHDWSAGESEASYSGCINKRRWILNLNRNLHLNQRQEGRLRIRERLRLRHEPKRGAQ